jgi:hypothetical protein
LQNKAEGVYKMEGVFVLALVVVLLAFAVLVWSQRNKEGSLWVKVFGVQAKMEQKESRPSQPITQEQVNAHQSEQSADIIEGVEVSQRQKNTVGSRQSVSVKK